jgi:O-antigen/teichoic acid export membrane protein
MLKIISPAVRVVASNTFFQLLSKFITMSITFALTYLISKNYGAYGYGLFSIFQSFPSLFYIISDFGLNAIGAREINKNQKDGGYILNNILILRAIISLALILICLLLSLVFYSDPQIRFGLALGSLIIISQTLVSTTNIIFQLKLRYDLSALTNIISYIFILSGSLVLIFNSENIVWVNFLYVLGSFLSFTLNLFLLRTLKFKFSRNFDIKYVKNLIILSWPLGLMFVFSQINFKADAVLLSVMPLPKNSLDNITSTGVYAFPYKIFEVILVLPTFLMNSTYPLLLNSLNQGIKTLKNNFKKTLFFMFGIGVLASIVLTSLAFFLLTPEVIKIFFNQEFIVSREILLILFSGIFLFFLTQPLAWYLILLGKQKILPLVYAISAIFNVSLNLIFIPQFTFYASSVITIVTELIILILLGYFTIRYWNQKNVS